MSNPRLSLALRSVGAAYIPPFGLNPPMLGGPGSEVFDVVIRMDGLDAFREEWKRALDVSIGKLRLKVLPLGRILASKQAANRPKDQRVIPVLRSALLAVKSRRKKSTPSKRKSTRRSARLS